MLTLDFVKYTIIIILSCNFLGFFISVISIHSKFLQNYRIQKRKIKAINQKSALLFLKEKINYKNNYNTKKDFLNRIVSEKNYRLNTNKKLNSLGILPNENQWEVIKNIKSDTLKFY